MIGYMGPADIPMKATVYMTTDSFEKVLQLYKTFGKRVAEDVRDVTAITVAEKK
jgi:hypothetical protein